jgi:uncharacterized protein (DUF58 family)
MTRTGIGALVGGVVLAVVGWVLVWPALVVLGVGALLLVALAMGYTRRQPRLEIDRQIHPARVPKGTPAIAYLTFTNHGRAHVPPMVALQPFGLGEVRLALPRLAGGQVGVRTYRLPTMRRGVFQLGPLELTRGDPFALVRSTQHHAGNDQIWVYPRILPLRPLPTGVNRSLEGPTSETAQEGTLTFHRIREYETGDDLRMIHWKSTARAGKLMVRHNVDTSQPYTVVVLDLRPAVYSEETFETAVDVAASVVNCSTFGRSPVELQTTDGKRLGGPETREAQPLVDHLAGVQPDPANSLANHLMLLRRERGGTALVVVTGVLDVGDLPVVASLRRRFQRLVVASIVPESQRPILFPGVHVLTATDGDELAGLWNLDAAR